MLDPNGLTCCVFAQCVFFFALVGELVRPFAKALHALVHLICRLTLARVGRRADLYSDKGFAGFEDSLRL